MAFQCVVVTPEMQVLDESLTQAVLPAHDGEICILTDRAPLLVKLGVGSLRLDLAGGQHREMFVNGGIAQMKDNRLTVLTDEAIAPEDIDAATARAEFAEASARVASDEVTAADRQRRMQRARVMQEMAKK
jgi:F-type H+-transporting ATPase subunit epsilon